MVGEGKGKGRKVREKRIERVKREEGGRKGK